MPQPDSTLLIVKSLYWFAAGCIIFFLLSAIKVHLLKTSSMISGRRALGVPTRRSHFHFILADINRDLLNNTLKYLFDYRAHEWPPPSSPKVNTAISILTGLTTFLKPYLIVAVVYSVLKLWIKMHFSYDESSVMLGEVQRLKTQIQSLGFIGFAKDHKAVILLAYGITCISIPFLFKRKGLTQKIRTFYTQVVNYASIILSISFFGTGIAQDLVTTRNQLEDTENGIVSLHNKMYSNIAKVIIVKDFENDVVTWSNDLRKIRDKLKVKIDDFDKNPHTRLGDEQETRFWFDKLTRDPLLEGKLASGFERKYPPTLSPVNNQCQAAMETEPTIIQTEPYFKSGEQWSKTGAEEIIKSVAELDTRKVKSTDLQKFESLVNSIVDFGIDKSAGAFLEMAGLKEHKVLKKLIETIFSETYRKSLNARILETAMDVKRNPIEKSRRLFTTDILIPVDMVGPTSLNSEKVGSKPDGENVITEVRANRIRELMDKRVTAINDRIEGLPKIIEKRYRERHMK